MENYINKEYYLPLLKNFCEKVIPFYDKGYDQGPFVPYAMPFYKNAPVKVMYVGRDTLYWEPYKTLYNAYKEDRLEDYLDANTKCVDVDKMLAWNNNMGSFWNFADKLHLLIRTGEYCSDINDIGEKERSILMEMGYGNLYSIEVLDTLKKKHEEPNCIANPEYIAICQAAKPFEMLKTMIEAYLPDVVFVLSWIEKNDFFDGTDYKWQERWYRESNEQKEYRSVYLSDTFQTKVIWTLHPNALWRKGFKREDIVRHLHFLTDTYNQLTNK